MSGPPDLFDHRDAVLALMRTAPTGLFSDIDGTLAPIVPDPMGAVVPDPARAALGALANRLCVIALSGRGVATARRMIGLDEGGYSGNHGAEWLEEGVRTIEPLAAACVDAMHEIARRAGGELRVEGLFVEDKGPSVSLHYRNAPDPPAARSAIFDFLADAAVGMTVREGKRVVEVRPTAALSKGEAVRSFTRRRGLASVLVIGDDLTDAEAFRVVREMRDAGEAQGAAVAVAGSDAPADVLAAADYALDGPSGVQRFLTWLAGAL